jgi:uncharacterized protein (DUF2237 family)
MARNVLGTPLAICGMDPVTGYFRNGRCDMGAGDDGMHVVCAEMTAEFLEFSKEQGNDLSTPIPEMGFEGVRPGDRWCLCLPRWIEALEAGMAPRVVLEATHASVVEYVSLEVLRRHAVTAAP